LVHHKSGYEGLRALALSFYSCMTKYVIGQGADQTQAG
jgi:hypothetical protein